MLVRPIPSCFDPSENKAVKAQNRRRLTRYYRRVGFDYVYPDAPYDDDLVVLANRFGEMPPPFADWPKDSY